jgi:sialate O-acetylesterase
MKTHFLLAALVAGLSFPSASPVALAQSTSVSEVTAKMPLLHPLFSDDAVLQRDRQIPIWGWSSPGQTLTVGIDGKKFVKTRAGADGKWMARIGPYPAGGPHTLTVDGGLGELATRTNILFGDVWLCSGQSNMEMGIKMVNNAAAEVAAADYPNIRLFTVPKSVSVTPQKLVNSQWLPCTPTNIAAGGWGGFSATAYFFGRKLNQELGIPIGLLHSSWGGTIAEAWVTESALGEIKDFDEQVATVKAAAAIETPFSELQDEWYAKADLGTKEDWANPTLDDSNWKSIKTPGDWEESPEPEFKNFDGTGWYRHDVAVPTSWASKDLTLRLGTIDDDDTTYWNGVEIGRTVGVSALRNYKIPAAMVKAGKNVISIRAYDGVGRGGLYGDPALLKLELDSARAIPLAGEWKFKTSTRLADLGDAPKRIDSPNTVTVLNNGMIAPLLPFAIKGAIWYQGESNAARAEQYERLLPTLIKSWRQQFDYPLSFYIVQLAGFMQPDNEPRDDQWPNLREAQMRTAQTVPKTGIALAIDIGDAGDIHPKNKQDVGLRLALSALAQDYGKKVPKSGPTLKSVKRSGSNFVLRFDNTEGGLTLDGDNDRVFAVAGADKKFHWASAKVQGQTVVLNSAEVKEPTEARYAWSNFPRGNLHNGAGLPAAPFATDK